MLGAIIFKGLSYFKTFQFSFVCRHVAFLVEPFCYCTVFPAFHFGVVCKYMQQNQVAKK